MCFTNKVILIIDIEFIQGNFNVVLLYGELVGEALLKPGEPGTPRLVMGTVPYPPVIPPLPP